MLSLADIIYGIPVLSYLQQNCLAFFKKPLLI